MAVMMEVVEELAQMEVLNIQFLDVVVIKTMKPYSSLKSILVEFFPLHWWFRYALRCRSGLLNHRV